MRPGRVPGAGLSACSRNGVHWRAAFSFAARHPDPVAVAPRKGGTEVLA